MSEHPVPTPKQPGAPSRLWDGLPAGAPTEATEDPALTALLRAVTAPATTGELAGEDRAIAAFLTEVFTRPPAPAPRRRSRVAVPAIAAMVSVFALGGTAAAAMTGSLPTPLQDFAHHLTGVPAPSLRPRPAPDVPTGPAQRHHPGTTAGHGPTTSPAARPTDLPSATLPVPSARPTGRDGATDDRGPVQSPTAGPRVTAGSQGRPDQGTPTIDSSDDTGSGHAVRPSTQASGQDLGQGAAEATATVPSGATPAPQPGHPAPPGQPHQTTTTNTTPGHGTGR